MARKKILRGKWRTYSKLGKRRKKKQKYRRATGIHNKIRLGMKGNPVKVKIGYKKPEKEKKIAVVKNMKELDEIKKGEQIILARLGKKKKLEIIKKVQEKKIIIKNLNVEKFFKKVEKQKKEKLEEKSSLEKTSEKKEKVGEEAKVEENKEVKK